jgi:hypothetical protein
MNEVFEFWTRDRPKLEVAMGTTVPEESHIRRGVSSTPDGVTLTSTSVSFPMWACVESLIQAAQVNPSQRTVKFRASGPCRRQ